MEINPILAWYLFFALFTLGFVFVMWTKREMRYVLYFIFGAILGFAVFDLPSVTLGYYTYSKDPLLFPVFGVPLTIPFAEGFAVSITIYIYELLIRKAKNLSKRR